MKYKTTPYGVHNTETGQFIPENPLFKEWRDYLDWLQRGNQPELFNPADFK